jgi:SAM-dependent methyltransferase
MTRPLYDDIGRTYSATRRDDPGIAAAIRAAIGPARRLVNVGAGTGSYEPPDLAVVAVEPSSAMIRQRRPGAAPVVQAVAEALPFHAGAFDVALAVLTMHHWTDRPAGLRELLRVAPRAVIVTWDPARPTGDASAPGWFWFTANYLPEIEALDAPRFPSIAELRDQLGPVSIVPLLIAADCQDGFLGAFWARPEAYLDPAVRRGISTFAMLPAGVVERGIARLAEDLRSGAWDARFGALRRAAAVDLGYRLVVSGARPVSAARPA